MTPLKLAGIILFSFLAGALAVTLDEPPETLPPTALPFMPAPLAEISCDIWHIRDAAPDFYWDQPDTIESTSTADYYTVSVVPEGELELVTDPLDREEWASVPPAFLGYVTLTYWDSDRPTEPQPLRVMSFKVAPLDNCG